MLFDNNYFIFKLKSYLMIPISYLKDSIVVDERD